MWLFVLDKLMKMSNFVGKLTVNDVKTSHQPTILEKRFR